MAWSGTNSYREVLNRSVGPSLVLCDGVHEVLLGEESGLAASVAVEDPEEGVLEVLFVLGLLVGKVWKMIQK